MEKTTFSQPLPDNLKPLMSDGYILASGKAKPFEVVQAWPAGSVSTAATDMARFMIAHLQNGEFNGARILRPETAVLMHTRQFFPNPALNGMALGFYEETRNGHRIIGHAGDTNCFHTDLHLLLNDGIGFFVSYNSLGKATLSNRTALWHKFLDRYFPYSTPTPEAIASAAADVREITGRYMVSRRLQGNAFEGLSMLGEAKVSPNADGTISISNSNEFNGQPKKFREIQPLVFQDVDGQDRVAFQRDAGGRLTFATDFPVFLFQRATFLQLEPLNVFILSASVGIMLLAVLLWPVAGGVRKHYGAALNIGKGARRRRLIVRLVCCVNLLFFLSLLVLLNSLNETLPTSHLVPKLHLVQFIGLLGALGTFISIYNAWRVWRPELSPAAVKATVSGVAALATASPQSRWWGSKVLETLIGLACLGFVWFLLYWDLLNFTSNF